MKQQLLQTGLAVVALCAAAGCSCEVKFGADVDEAKHDPPVRHVAAAVDPVLQPIAADSGAQPTAAAAVAPSLATEPVGVLSEASLRKTAARHRNELLFCMEQEQTAKPPSLRVQFLVKPDGSVDNEIKVLERSDMPDRLASCMVSALKRWSFERPKGGAARATLLLKR
jgi:hypothetical protein